MSDNLRTAASRGKTSFQSRASRRAALLAGAAAILTTGLAGAQTSAPDVSAGAAPELEEITVTATRRAEDIQRVPITITAYSQAQMDEQGIKQIDDLARLTPDIYFTHTTGSAGNNISDISIRANQAQGYALVKDTLDKSRQPLKSGI